MGKKQRRGKGKTRGQPAPTGDSRVYMPREGQILGVVIRILGGNHIEVMSADNIRRTIRIPGKIRRRVWVRANDVVVVEPWHDVSEDNKGDLIYRYRPTEIIRLARNKRFLTDLENLGVEIPKQYPAEGEME